MRPSALCASASSAARMAWLGLMALWSPPVWADDETAKSNTEVTLSRRDSQQFQSSDVSLLSTLDGSLQARNRDTGAISWTLESSQLVEITETGPRPRSKRDTTADPHADSNSRANSRANPSFSSDPSSPPSNDRDSEQESSDQQRIMWLAEPSADGGSYFFTPESGIERIPASVQDLVQKAPFGMVGNIVYTGSRQTTLYAVDIQTGEILQAFGSYLDYANPSAVHAAMADPMRVIMIGRTEYTSDMHEQLGAPGWRVRIGVWTPNSRDQDLAAQYTGPLDSVFVTPLNNSTVMALAENDMRPQRWVSEVPASLVDVFDVSQSSTDRSSASVRQPPLKLSGPTDKQGHSWDSYVSKAADGSAVIVRGPRYSASLGTVPQAVYCDRTKKPSADTFADIMGVHPAWCQEKRRNPSSSPPAMSLSPPSVNGGNTPFPRLDPPEPSNQLDSGSVVTTDVWQAWQASNSSTLIALILGALIMAAASSSYRITYWPWKQPERGRTRFAGSPSSRGSSQDADSFEDGEPKRRKRGSRGGKNRRQNRASSPVPPLAENSDGDGLTLIKGDVLMKSELVNTTIPVVSNSTGGVGGVHAVPPITVSDVVLGYGSHGTTVFKGRFENRDVAVKRMSLEFYDVASQEVDISRESDDHPNVVRYFYKYQTDQFSYIALESCPGTLEELVRGTHQFSISFDPLEALRQITQGLQHSHHLQIVHRDIKPQNILVALPSARAKQAAKNSRKRIVPTMGVRYLISDFGLCRKLEGEQSSFSPTAADSAAGTAGWAAPEISSITSQINNANNANYATLAANQGKTPARGPRTRTGGRPDEANDGKPAEDSAAVDGSDAANVNSTGVSTMIGTSTVVGPSGSRLTKAVDIFSMGCLFYYVSTGGKHPFGDTHMRQVNIQQGKPPVLERGGLMTPEALDLIPSMSQSKPGSRPTVNEILKHPMFWSEQMKLDFSVRVSDRSEHESREEKSELIDRLEVNAAKVVGKDWHQKFPQVFVDNSGKYRRYHGDRILDSSRALRNKSHHYNDFSDESKACVGQVPHGYLAFFTDRFPHLLVTVYYYAKTEFFEEDMFKDFFQ